MSNVLAEIINRLTNSLPVFSRKLRSLMTGYNHFTYDKK